MRWLVLLSCAAGLGLIGVPAAYSGFVTTASLGMAFGTAVPAETEHTLSRIGTGSCEAEIFVKLDSEADIQLEQTAYSLVISGQRDETAIHGRLQGSCEEPKEMKLQYVAESSTNAAPVLLINAPSEHSFIADQDWEREFTLLLSTQNDKMYLQGWEELEVTTSQSPPSIMADGSWLILQPENWQQYWQSNLTWPETASDYFSAEGCHSLFQVFFPKDLDLPCLAASTSVVATRVPRIRSWYGWQDADDSQWLASLPTRPPTLGEIRITEVMWAGSFSTLNHSADEWVELLNTTGEYLSLDSLQLLKARSGGEALMFPTGLKIAPHSYFVIGKPTAESLLSRPADWQTRNLSLSNTEANIRLQTNSGVVIDSLPSGTWQAGENDVANKQRSSAQLKHLSLPSNNWTSWIHCSREDEDRCWHRTHPDWKGTSAKNLASPWNASVL